MTRLADISTKANYGARDDEVKKVACLRTKFIVLAIFFSDLGGIFGYKGLSLAMILIA